MTIKYFYDAANNEFTKDILDPKTNNKILKNSSIFEKRMQDGYAYMNEKLLKPSLKTDSAFYNIIVSYDLTIVNQSDPVDQMNKLKQRVQVLLTKALNKSKGIKFAIGMDILFSKPDPSGEIIITQTFYININSSTITHESMISDAIQTQREDISRRIDRLTANGSVGLLKKLLDITFQFLNINL